MINIATSICVDTSSQDEGVIYPQIADKNSKQRREIYWRLVTTFCFSSLRCNPKDKHIVFTNDIHPIIIGKNNIKVELQKRGVEIKILPFETFVPPRKNSPSFRNTFYKLDVIKALGQLELSNSILLDSDCLWTQPNEELKLIIASGKILLYELKLKQNASDTTSKYSNLDVGELYSSVDQNYPISEPRWYGGELIGGNSKQFQFLAQQLEKDFNVFLNKVEDASLSMDRKNRIFNGEECLANYVYNKAFYRQDINVFEAQKFIKRIWTSKIIKNVDLNDLNIPIWHLPAEKTEGLKQIYDESSKSSSDFWTIPLDNFNQYLGEYVGVPKKKRFTLRQIVFNRIPLLRTFEKLLKKIIKNNQK